MNNFLRRNTFLVGVTFFCFAFSSCTTTGVVVNGEAQNLTGIRKAFVTTFGQPRMMSSNGRELFTKYHEKDLLLQDTMDPNIKTRYYTKVIILGESRPYDISVDVIKEIRQGNKFQTDLHDEALSIQQAKRLKENLDKSRDEFKSIDDLSPF